MEKSKKQEQKLSQAIFLSIEMESAFKLYAYRVISPEVFTQKTTELIQMYQSEIKKLK